MDLTQYETLKFQLAGVLRGVRQSYSRARQQEPPIVRDLFARLAADRLTIAMVGRFSRGKTSLMNAVLATDLLPVGVVPITSVITLVSYGSAPKVVLHYQNTNLYADIPISELPAHITEQGNPGNRQGISVAEVQIPADFLRHGFTFVDTPGLGSAIRANTRTTEAFLPEVDAIVLVSSHDSPLSEEEARILEAALQAGRPLFIVLNKHDMVDTRTRAATVAHVEELVASLRKDAPVAVFSVSATQGLAAKLGGNAVLLRESGLPALETALVDFLLTQRHNVFLRGMYARIAPLLCDPVGPDCARQLETIREQVSVLPAPLPPPVEPSVAPLLPGCEICAAVNQASFDFLAHYQATLYADTVAQDDLVQRGGFCQMHARQFEALAADREISAAYAPLLLHLSTTVRNLSTLAGAQDWARQIANLVPGATRCPACEVARKAEQIAITRLAADIRSRPSMPAHSALCLPHLSRLLAVLPPEASRQVLQQQAALLGRLAEDAQRYVLRYDAGRRDLFSQEDRAAAERASRVLHEHPNAQYPHLPRTEVGTHFIGR